MSKRMTDDELEVICRDLDAALEHIRAAWEAGMKSMLLSSSEYRQICSAGRRAMKAHETMKNIAFERGWSREKMNEVFGLSRGVYTYFS